MHRSLLAYALLSILYISPTSADSQAETLNLVHVDFNRPLAYSKESISYFLKHIFNHPHYAQDFLALNFAHVSQIMSLAPKHPHPRRFIRKGLGLFSLKLQDIRYINSYSFCTFIEDLITYTAPYTNNEADKNDLIESFKRTIGAYLVDKFELLKEEPEQALTELSMKLYTLVEPYEKQDISIRELQHVMHYFLSQALHLLVWSPENQQDTWHCMIAIANRLEQCAVHAILDRDMLDDLYWILLHRYTYFLSLAGPELQPEFFDHVSAALQDMKNSFWFTEERELYISTKYEYLQKALIQEDAASRLIAAGYIQ
jgi:hypothetical protein